MMKKVTHHQASQLLHNKFVVVLGDSIQRSVYKDLVLLLQTDSHLSLSQLKSKGELSFEKDCLVEGGRLGHMSNGTEYREVRQYRSDHHLVRFYFVTRVFSRYMESILADFKNDLKPDVVIVNSCVWDLSRYNRRWVSEYKENLHKFFSQLKAILTKKCLVIWNMTMPLGERIRGGFLVSEIEDIGTTLRFDVIEANFYGAMLANKYGLDVLDLHFRFRFSLHCRMKDGVHWNAVAHRQITYLLLAHAAQAWGVELPSHTAKGDSSQKRTGVSDILPLSNKQTTIFRDRESVGPAVISDQGDSSTKRVDSSSGYAISSSPIGPGFSSRLCKRAKHSRARKITTVSGQKDLSFAPYCKTKRTSHRYHNAKTEKIH
ncbi:PC-esterase domain-containing protein 1A isoform X4 [Astyanax mexicanus]|uniref:PC-esterase domain-containing protein 1A isoform X4 n=1 Tax=Astyanax mexicanus TaxID=7994 RepID=UPI0020CB2675|nr:PC-esterase domain-containing protein 1A isoform X4 [Astyanax mexicanus]